MPFFNTEINIVILEIDFPNYKTSFLFILNLLEVQYIK